MKKQLNTLAPLALAALLTTAPCARSDDIISKTSSMPQFSKLTQAIKAAGLEGGLSGRGSFTLFAPTDTAFARLPNGTWEELMQPERRAVLRSILKYHVLPKRFSANSLKRLRSGTNLRTLNNETFAVRTKNVMGASVALDTFRSGTSNVRQTGIRTDNGVIHAIDQVLIPPSLAYELARNPQYKNENRAE